MLDTLLINPNNRIQSPFAGVEPPLWASLIASDLIRREKKVAILDAEALDLTVEETVKQIYLANPKQVIFVVMGNNPSVSSTPKMVVTKKLINVLHHATEMTGLKIAVTGLHPSALPEETEKELGVEVLRGKIFWGTPDIHWDLLPMDKYIAHNWHCLDGSSRQPYASTYTSLGCPFACEFCNVHALYNGEHKLWYRDVDSLIREIDTLVNKYKVRNIKFWDELFTAGKKHVEVICDKLIEREYDLNIWAYARVDTVNPKLLEKMKRARINWLGLGFESGSDGILKSVLKKATKADSIKAVEMIHEAGINVGGNFLFGLPDDTMETMLETLEFAKSLNLEYANFYFAEILPGAPIYNGKNKDWSTFGQFNPKVRSEANDFRDMAFLEFFSDANYQENIRRKFGEQAVKQIKSMLAYGKPKTREYD